MEEGQNDTELTVSDILRPTQPKKREIRGGIISVATHMLADHGIRTRECGTQGSLADTGVFAQVHALLCLPETYTIQLMIVSLPNPTNWQIYVEGPDLPEVDRYCEPRAITPIYVRGDDGSVRLKGIRVEEKWLRTYTPGELTPDTL